MKVIIDPSGNPVNSVRKHAVQLLPMDDAMERECKLQRQWNPRADKHGKTQQIARKFAERENRH